MTHVVSERALAVNTPVWWLPVECFYEARRFYTSIRMNASTVKKGVRCPGAIFHEDNVPEE